MKAEKTQLPFDGRTFVSSLDGARLTTQFKLVAALMLDGRWRTLAEIAAKTGGSEAGVSARLRDFRKEKFGGHTVARRRRGDAARGLHEYRLIASVEDPPKRRR